MMMRSLVPRKDEVSLDHVLQARFFRPSCLAISVFFGLILHVRADFLPISQPIKSYVDGTKALPLDAPDYWSIGYSSDSVLGVAYDPFLNVRTVPGTWATWNVAPAVESSDPRVATTQDSSMLTITLGSQIHTFGFELEPNDLAKADVIAYYFDATALVGSIHLQPAGKGGALLYAASTSSDVFTSVRISDLSGGDFAIAQQRYSLTPMSDVPEPQLQRLTVLALATTYLIYKFRHS